jgi:hypothetical protein
MSLSFHDQGGTVLASIADSSITQDANGYATLIVGTGATVPAWVTAANGYTFVDLTAAPTYKQLSLVTMRHIMPSGGFNCAGQFVPYRTTADTPTGSLMSDYMPVVDYPLAANLPQAAAPLIGPSPCEVFPAGQPGNPPACGVLPSPTPAISQVLTQCLEAGCGHFDPQANPPITISGAGFGSFPNGMPFTGTSNYLRITDATQNWIAGYTGGTCGVSITSWDTGRIQLVANASPKLGCALAAGDKVLVEVWNPQTMVEAVTKVTVTTPQ